MDELRDQDGIVNVVERLAEIWEAHSQELTSVVNAQEPVVHHV